MPGCWRRARSFVLRARRVCAAAVFASVAGSSPEVLASDCGDDLGGRRVACACGDTVVSDTTLQLTDPVVRGRCSGNGLVLMARGLEESLVLDLAGLSIVGSGVGDGITAVAGGSDGAVIRGGTPERRGEIVGFGTGIHVRAGRTVRRIEMLELEGQRHHGLLLHSAGTFVVDVQASRNGGDGIRVAGHGGRLLGVVATGNRRAGVRVSSRYTIVQARADGNAEHGIVVRGTRTDLRGSVASRNAGYGIVLGGHGHATDDVVTDDNGIGAVASGNRRKAP